MVDFSSCVVVAVSYRSHPRIEILAREKSKRDKKITHHCGRCYSGCGGS